MMQTYSNARDLPRLHVTPLPKLICESHNVIVEVNDKNRSRIRLTFSPYQAVRMITADCFEVPEGLGILRQNIIEIGNSSWIEQLRHQLSMADEDADFMDYSKHFLLPLQDEFLEVVAWEVALENLARSA